jgi:translation initiation factor eIF-2B subunit gamma
MGVCKRRRISAADFLNKDCLLGENVIVAAGAVIKESVIGANCHIAGAARIILCPWQSQ